MNEGANRRSFLKIMGFLACGCTCASHPFSFSWAPWGCRNASGPVYTRFPQLDEIMGGFRPSELVLLAGRPNTGKFTLAMDIAFNAAVRDGAAVGFFSVANPGERIALEILARSSGGGSELMRSGKLSPARGRHHLECSKTLTDVPLWVEDVPVISVSRLWKSAGQLKKRHSLDLIIIHYLQLLRGWRERPVVKPLKAMAEELGTPVLLVSNLSRHVDYRLDKRPKLSDLALLPGRHGEEIIEPLADVVLLTYRDKWAASRSSHCGGAGEFPNSEAKGVTEIIVSKNRVGATGIAKLGFDRRRWGFAS